MAATCAVAAPADLFSVCHQGSWTRNDARLRFLLGGILFHTATLPGLLLDVPFTHVAGDASEPPPPPRDWPAGIEAARIRACPLEPKVRRVALLAGAIRYVAAQYRHFYIDLEGSFPTYLAKYGSRSRNTFKRKQRRFMETAGTAQPWRVFSQPAQMAEFHRLALAVSRQTYQHRLLDAGIPEGGDFVEMLTARAARNDARGYILMHSGRPICYGLCFSYGATITYEKTGFDPEFAQWHPGTVLTYMMLEEIFAERRWQVFDFGGGDFPYKEYFATGSVRCANILYLRKTARNLLLVAAHSGLDALSAGVKSFLDRLGLKDRIKKIVHRF